MNTRRDFFKSAAAIGLLGTVNLPLASLAEDKTPVAPASGDDRAYWVSVADRIARPVLTNLAQRTLKQNMPVECFGPGLLTSRKNCTYLEALGRLLDGLAPWLAVENLTDDELKLQSEYRLLAQKSLDAATDPASPDFLNYSKMPQNLVDTAFLAQAILRAPDVLWKQLEPRVQKQIVDAFKASRKLKPTESNWVIFAATIEAALLEFGEPTTADRLEDEVRKMINWYAGDGAYGDGAFFHFDYYNSFVIHPMLLTVLGVLVKHDPQFAPALKIELERATRFAAIQERLIGPDGIFPSIGRSTTYRFGAFQTLGAISLMRELPKSIKPAQVRCALTAVIRRITEATGTFDANGWLQIGFCGHQPKLGEDYISTGSLYLCSVGLLPLGLPPTDEFWSAPAARWTSQQIWSGEDVRADHHLTDVHTVEIPTLKRGA